jgi:hypothetical protein
MPEQPHFDKQPNGAPGKKQPAPSVKRRGLTSFSTMVEILSGQKPRQANEVKTGPRP